MYFPRERIYRVRMCLVRMLNYRHLFRFIVSGCSLYFTKNIFHHYITSKGVPCKIYIAIRDAISKIDNNNLIYAPNFYVHKIYSRYTSSKMTLLLLGWHVWVLS